MKRIIAIVMAVVLLLMLAMPAYAGGPATKDTGKNAAAMIPTVQMWPNYNTYQILGAKGKVNMIQPNGNVDVILGVGVDGLALNSRYTVWFDTNGVIQNDYSTAGPWQFMGQFWTDGNGHGDWNYTVPAGTFSPGTYTRAVAINRTDVNVTVLMSFNIVFTIANE